MMTLKSHTWLYPRELRVTLADVTVCLTCQCSWCDRAVLAVFQCSGVTVRSSACWRASENCGTLGPWRWPSMTCCRGDATSSASTAATSWATVHTGTPCQPLWCPQVSLRHWHHSKYLYNSIIHLVSKTYMNPSLQKCTPPFTKLLNHE